MASMDFSPYEDIRAETLICGDLICSLLIALRISFLSLFLLSINPEELDSEPFIFDF